MNLRTSQLKPAEIARQRLHAAGFKCTPQRQEVFEEIVKTGGHLSAEDLAVRLSTRTRGPRISRATVYRTLSLLVQCGLVREVIFTEDHTHYEAAYSDRHHEHMVCTKCGRTIEFDDSDLERTLRNIALETGFTPMSHKVEVYGLCSKCR